MPTADMVENSRKTIEDSSLRRPQGAYWMTNYFAFFSHKFGNLDKFKEVGCASLSVKPKLEGQLCLKAVDKELT